MHSVVCDVHFPLGADILPSLVTRALAAAREEPPGRLDGGNTSRAVSSSFLIGDCSSSTRSASASSGTTGSVAPSCEDENVRGRSRIATARTTG